MILCSPSRKSIFRAGEGEGGKEEKWNPTLVTLLLVQVGSPTATFPCGHWLRDNLKLFIYKVFKYKKNPT